MKETLQFSPSKTIWDWFLWESETIISLSYPIDPVLFNEETHSCITLASQFLGLDTNGYVTESLLSLLFVLSTCPIESELPGQSFQSCCLNFNKFLDENICSKLVNFHDTKVFRF